MGAGSGFASEVRVPGGTRIRDLLSHIQTLYQLSYGHSPRDRIRTGDLRRDRATSWATRPHGGYSVYHTINLVHDVFFPNSFPDLIH